MARKVEEAINKNFFSPIRTFIANQKSGGIVLGISVLVALIIANTSWGHTYHEFFEHELGLIWDGDPFFRFSLHHWINDGLMAMFFFVVGLELKREFIAGELSDPRKTLLPIVAAVSGMLFPAVIYLFLNHGGAGVDGWGIPMATDIAFALAVIYLLGDRISASAKVFLTTLAIVDDLGAVLVIAFFYTSDISLINLGLGLGFLICMFAANKIGIKSITFYAVIGILGVWSAFLLSGIHATIAAVLAAFMIPADCKIDEWTYLRKLERRINAFRNAPPNEVMTLEEAQVRIIGNIRSDSKAAIPPLQRLEHAMSPFVTFVVMPIFALANAGVSFEGAGAETVLLSPITWGVICGLLIGKPLGITLAVYTFKIMPGIKQKTGLSLKTTLGLGFLAAIGFTMSTFVSTLALNDESHLTQAKVGILIASLLGGVTGYILLNDKKKSGNKKKQSQSHKP